eukprot:5722370-Prymnesium_polylepis.1
MQEYLLLDPSIAPAQHAAPLAGGWARAMWPRRSRRGLSLCAAIHTARTPHKRATARRAIPCPPLSIAWVRHGRCLRHRSACRAGARSAAHA